MNEIKPRTIGAIKNDRTVVFRYFANCRLMVQLTTGWVGPDGVVRHDYVVVRNAPAKVVSEIIERFVMVSLVEDGLLIPLDN